MNLNLPCQAGFTLVELMLVVSLIGLLASIAVPNYFSARADSQRAACISNLREIDAAIQQYAAEQKLARTASVTVADCAEYLKHSAVCPAGGTTINDSYSVTDCQTPPACIARGGGAAKGHVLP